MTVLTSNRDLKQHINNYDHVYENLTIWQTNFKYKRDYCTFVPLKPCLRTHTRRMHEVVRCSLQDYQTLVYVRIRQELKYINIIV